MTHWTSMTVAFRLACSAGKATLTTVPSMNAMLEPRIVAARIQGPEVLGQGAAALPDRMTPSSHGCLAMLAIASFSLHKKTPTLRLSERASTPDAAGAHTLVLRLFFRVRPVIRAERPARRIRCRKRPFQS